jgi:hypothetical protein
MVRRLLLFEKFAHCNNNSVSTLCVANGNGEPLVADCADEPLFTIVVELCDDHLESMQWQK